MEEIKQEFEIITIRKEEGTKKDGNKFDKFVFNKDGNAVQLSFRKDSNNISGLPYGISKIKVKNLKPAFSSFYPKYYATFIEMLPKEN